VFMVPKVLAFYETRHCNSDVKLANERRTLRRAAGKKHSKLGSANCRDVAATSRF
jgi:hypothetical protein